MSGNNGSSQSGGIGFVGVLQIVFLVLKLVDVIDWSWWWVFSPLWISVGLTLLILGILFLAMLVLDKE
jgi:hypothetical protein